VLAHDLDITSPKRNSRSNNAWEGFFPYYAGFPESFASRILSTCGLSSDSLIFDPWNGSGTTTYASSKLGFSSVGFDINPAMVVIGRARLLAASEADSLVPLCKKILLSSHARRDEILPTEPLLAWFGPQTAKSIRFIEEGICSHLVGRTTISDGGVRLENLSGIAAALYVALFSICRSMCLRFRTSNPTWFRVPAARERRISISRSRIEDLFLRFVASMSEALHGGNEQLGTSTIRLADSSVTTLDAETVDLVLTSPPYCTRIDYAAATRVELGILAPMLGTNSSNLRRKMMGSIQVPETPIEPNSKWGKTCVNFLDSVRGHSSKASASYYHKTHLDYFEKLFSSFNVLSTCLKRDGLAIDYKNLHNDLAEIASEMASAASMILTRREDFFSTRSMSGINGRSRAYDRPLGATESVLCFKKLGAESF